MNPKITTDARLQWKCRRGLLELDLMLQSILTHHYQNFSESEKNTFNCMLDMPDPELLQLLLGQETYLGDDEEESQLLLKLISSENTTNT